MTSPREHDTAIRTRVAAARATRGARAWRGGFGAEQAACDALTRDGWTILLRRARTAAGEIDIVAERCRPEGETLLAFVEVKHRPSLAGAAASLTPRQQRRLLLASEILLALNTDWRHAGIRFDLMLVDGSFAVRRIADAFRQEQR